MTKPGYIQVTSTSSTTADVTPVVLRDGQRKRLVFTPVLVDNEGEPAATVRGELSYFSKNAADEWERDKPFDLRTLAAGESIRLDLSSRELLKMFNCVAALYEFMADTGFEYGTKRLLSVDAGTDLAEILDSISAIGQDQHVKRVLGWMSRQDSEQLAHALQDAEPEISTRIVIATGLAKLRGFIEEASAELESADEKLWQGIIERNAWAIGQVFSHPLVVVKREAYLGGKSVHNTGGNNADFLLRNQVTGNALIVELKTPATSLTAQTPYRNNAYPPSKELAGAVQQVLQDHYSLRQNYSALAGDKPPDFRVFKPKLLLIVGNLAREDDIDRVRSFELYRNSIPDVEIVTFDELVEKAKLLLDLFEDSV
ncbi:Shedu immune nuclease family protein [Amycolatopsis solani]|uniref:Shedu immune nuclease family protein n=1 Tax=Amycolatopsis solani TaxID=3028615 RepID=UPI0025AFCDE2|nr:Shedu immune nuclease family protein [Amycolatopsis sp. MEP2-6]